MSHRDSGEVRVNAVLIGPGAITPNYVAHGLPYPRRTNRLSPHPRQLDRTTRNRMQRIDYCSEEDGREPELCMIPWSGASARAYRTVATVGLSRGLRNKDQRGGASGR